MAALAWIWFWNRPTRNLHDIDVGNLWLWGARLLGSYRIGRGNDWHVFEEQAQESKGYDSENCFGVIINSHKTL